MVMEVITTRFALWFLGSVSNFLEGMYSGKIGKVDINYISGGGMGQRGKCVY